MIRTALTTGLVFVAHPPDCAVAALVNHAVIFRRPCHSLLFELRAERFQIRFQKLDVAAHHAEVGYRLSLYPKIYRLAASMSHRWQEQLFLNAALALQGNHSPERNQEHQRIEKLEKKIRQKDEVLAGLMAEHVALKKELGEIGRA